MSAVPTLQVSYLWKGQVIAYRLVGRRDRVTIGDHKSVVFATPRLTGFPARFLLLRPAKDGFRLRLGPGMAGTLKLRGQRRTVGDVLLGPAQKRFLRDPGMFRETDLYPGDSATIELDVEKPGNLQLVFTFAEAPERLARPRLLPEPLLVRTTAGTALALLALVLVARVVSDQLIDTSMQVSERIVRRVVRPQVEMPPPPRSPEKLAEAERRKQDQKGATAKRARHDQGRLGRDDAPARPTELPKGREDILRAKVARTGILAALGNSRAPGSGLARLFDNNDSNDLEQAMNGLAGGQLVAGKGAGGLGAVGTGVGGGGVGLGSIAGSGDLKVGGGGRGRGSKGPGLGRGKEKEVSAGLVTGDPNAEGGLTREQVTRVVRAHAAAIKYCYEKELQRQPTLSGKIEVFWIIRPNGSVERTKIASSTVASRDVEGCIERQVRNWQFPRSDADTIVQTFPFFFKGGAG